LTIVPILQVLTVEGMKDDIYTVFFNDREPESVGEKLGCYVSFKRSNNEKMR